MNDEKMSLLFNTKLGSFEKINENFLKAKTYVMALGKNRNKSHFSKENIEKAYSSLNFVPVVGHLMCDDNGTHYLGGHDVSLDLSTLTLKSKCVPFGVAVPSETPVFEDIVEKDGTTSTYLVSDIILWVGRYPELMDAIYDEETYFAQSMEILYSKSEKLKEDPMYTDIIDFSFDALCLLGKSDDERFNVEPCFPSASVKPVTYSLDKNEFSVLMSELKEQLSFCINNKNNQGGVDLDKKLKILNKYGKAIEDLNFTIDDMSEDELSKKMEELFDEKPAPFSATYNERRKALSNALDPIIIKDDDGYYVEETYFYIEDFSDEYVFVEKDHWTKDNYECTHGRFSYEFDEAALTATITSEFEEMFKVWLTLEEKAKLDEERASYELLKQEYESYKNDYSHSNADYEVLFNYKEKMEKAERKNAEEKVFSEFEDRIGSVKEFIELKKNAKNYTLENLKKECFCILGLYAYSELNENNNETKNKKQNEIRFAVDQSNEDDNDPYGGLKKRYKG